MIRRVLYLLPVVALGFVPAAHAQTVGGAILGTVKDAQGLVMPGVTVTLSGEAVLGEQVAVTLEDGTYRFRALRPGAYNIRFELSGFQTLNREGIIVEGNRTF
ncbi:MAG: carboxypeptidase-like regulatory domain-containing protein, partial [Acidobacteriota bacterium]